MKTLAALLLVFFVATWAPAANWAQWRGPYFNGSTDETGLPRQWSTTENVSWSAELPGPSAATPIIWNDHVFLSSSDPSTDTLCAMCFDRKTGDLLWRHDVAKGIRKDSRSNYASPSPATDGETVVFFYGNGNLAAYDFSGQKLWSRNIQDDYGPFAFQWTFSTSPVMSNGKLYLQVLQRDEAVNGQGLENRENESYLLAMHPRTGETLWRHVRPSQARVESREAFTTPIPLDHGGNAQLLIAGGDELTSHDPETGEELWRWGTWNPGHQEEYWRLVPSPVAGDDVVLVCAPKRAPVYAVRTGGTAAHGQSALAWTSADDREVSSDVPTPAFYDGDFFVLSDVRNSLSRVEPRTGKVKWTVRTPGSAKYEASPLVADGKIYLINFVADVVVVDAADGGIISRIPMDKPRDDAVRSSIAAAQGQLFIRTNTRLFCIGE